MKKLKLFLTLTLTVFALFAFTFNVQAEKGKQKSKLDKLSHKVHFLMKNQAQIGISDEQMGQIKGIVQEASKTMIKQNADIEVMGIDMHAMMYSNAIDVQKMNSMIDQKYEIKKARAKTFVKAMSDLKSVLTDDQKGKMKEVYYSSKGGHHGSGHGSKKGSH